MPTLQTKKTLSPDDVRRTLILINEAKVRGIEIPKPKKISLVNDWGLDEKGYFIRIDGRQYNPKGDQAAFIECHAIFSGFQGGRGSGKTAAGAQKALRKIMEGKSGAVVNPDLENFKTSTWPELRQWIPWNMVIPRQRYRKSEAWDVTRPFVMVFVNGATMSCRGLHDPESARGHNVNWLWYDEGRRDKSGAAWRNAIAGVRIGDDTERFLTTTPAGKDSWIAALFDRKEIPEETLKLLTELGILKNRSFVESFHCSIQDNKENLDPVFYATIVSQYPTGYLRMREVEGIAANEEGALGSREWFTEGGHTLLERPEWAAKRVRFWDLAASEKKVGTDPDETVGTLLSTDTPKERFCIENQVGGWWLWDKIKENIKTIALQDGPSVVVYIEQEPASGGKNQVAEIALLLKPLGIKVKPHNPRDDGDRVLAANTWFGEAASGFFYIVKGLWNDRFYRQLDDFPEGGHDDRVTSVTGARHSIAPIRKWRKQKFVSISSIKPASDKKPVTDVKSNGEASNGEESTPKS